MLSQIYFAVNKLKLQDVGCHSFLLNHVSKFSKLLKNAYSFLMLYYALNLSISFRFSLHLFKPEINLSFVKE